MELRERIRDFLTLTLVPALRRMFGKRRWGNTVLLICTFYLIAAMLGVICLSHHVNLRENDRLAEEYQQYITSAATATDAESSAAAAEAYNHILASKVELTAVFVFLMVVWGVLSAFALARVFHATVEQDKYVFGLYVTFGSDTRQIRRRIHIEFLLAALISLVAALPTATLLTRGIYLRNGQAFRPTLAPYLQILLWLFAVSLVGAAYLSHRITASTCVELMAALDCSDYVTSPRTSRLFGKHLYNGALRYARLAVQRMRGYYIPLVLTVSLVAAVFFGSMNLALSGEREAAESIHEYTLEFSRGMSGEALSSGYLDPLLALDDVESVSASANGAAERIGTHLLAEKSLFSDPDSPALVDCGRFYATDDIRILCADSDTRRDIGSDVVLPDEWQPYAAAIQTTYNCDKIPEAGTVIYLVPAEREAELAVEIGDTLRLALPREGAGGTLSEKLDAGGCEYLSLTVADVVTVPSVYYVTPNSATYVCPRITEDMLLLSPEDYAAVTQAEVTEQLSLDELYREDFAMEELTSPAVLLLPEGFAAADLTSVLMFAPTERITEPYSVTDPLTKATVTLKSDRFYLNNTATNTSFYLGSSGSYANDAEASDYGGRLLAQGYAMTELTVVAKITCPDLDTPCIILPNEDNFFSSYSGDMCILQLSSKSGICGVRREVFAFGTDALLRQDDYTGKQLFLHTEIEPDFFDEMAAQGLYTTYEDESAYALSSFSILSLFERNGTTYFLCALSSHCNLGMDRYPAYMAPGEDFIFLGSLTETTARRLSATDSYLMFSEAQYREDCTLNVLPVGEFAAVNSFTVSVADAINTAQLTPELAPPALATGECALVVGKGSDLSSLQAGDYIQLAVRADILLDLSDPQSAALEGTALLEYLLQSDYSYITLQVTEVTQSDATEDILYLCETDWGRICRTNGAYESVDIYLFGDTDLVSLIGTASRIRALIAGRQTAENRIELVTHNRLWQAVTTGACNYPAVIRTLSVLLILLLPLLWCAPQLVHFGKRRDEFLVMDAVGRPRGYLHRMIAAECLLITLLSGAFVALLCPLSVLCVRAAIYFAELPFETSDFDTRAYLFMIVFVMLCSALSYLAASRRVLPRETQPKERKGAEE